MIFRKLSDQDLELVRFSGESMRSLGLLPSELTVKDENQRERVVEAQTTLEVVGVIKDDE